MLPLPPPRGSTVGIDGPGYAVCRSKTPPKYAHRLPPGSLPYPCARRSGSWQWAWMLRCGNLCRRIGQFQLSFPETLVRTMRGTETLPTFRRIPDRISEVPRVWLEPFLRATPPVALTLPPRPTCLWMGDLAPDQSVLLRRLWIFCQHKTYRCRCGRSCLLPDALFHVPHCLDISRRPSCCHTLPLSFTTPRVI